MTVCYELLSHYSQGDRAPQPAARKISKRKANRVLGNSIQQRAAVAIDHLGLAIHMLDKEGKFALGCPPQDSPEVDEESEEQEEEPPDVEISSSGTDDSVQEVIASRVCADEKELSYDQLSDCQKNIYDKCAPHLNDPLNPETLPPEVTLLTGQAGTGKSAVIKALMKLAKKRGHKVLCMAHNNTNAIDLGGPTLLSFCSIDLSDSTTTFKPMRTNALATLRTGFDMDHVKLIVVDEI